MNKKIAFKKVNLTIFSLLFTYKILLDVAYIFFVSKYFGYMRFNVDFKMYKYILSFILFFGTYLILPKDKEKPSSIFMQLHFIIMILPMFTVYAFMNQSDMFLILSIIIFSSECILLKIIPEIKIYKIKNSKSILYIILASITLFVYFSMIKANGIPTLTALNILKVYDIRGFTKYPFLMEYLVNWQAKVINPFLISISYIYRNKKLLLISILLQVLLYLITAHKSYLFIILAILVIIYIVNRYDFLKLISTGAVLGVSISLILVKIFDHIILASFFVRRLLFVPAQLKFFYYDFFVKNQFLYFSEGVIGKIFRIKSPYAMKTVNMIGDIYFNNPMTAANTGYIADAYANMGILGMVIIGLLLVFILVLVDSLSRKIGKEITVGLAIFPVMSLNDGAFLTTMLTGGFLFLLAVLYLYSNTKEDEARVIQLKYVK